MRLRRHVRRPEFDSPFETRWAWRGGAMAGLVATVVTGLTISVMRLPTLQTSIAGLYGFEGNLTVGWLAHLFHGVLFGLVFAAVLADPGLFRADERLWTSVVVGIGYGLLLAIVGAGIIMPIWLGVVGFPTPPPIPNLTIPLLVWHLVYGLVLGVVFPFVEDL